MQFGGKADGKGGFGGVLLLISHDRALLQDVCDTIVILDGEGNTRVFEGSYREWEARQKVERSEAVQRAKKPDGKSVQMPSKHGSSQQSSHISKSNTMSLPSARPNAGGTATKAKGRFTSLPLEKIEARIADIGRELRSIDSSFADPRVASDSTKTKNLLARREEIQKEQTELEDEWVRKSG